MENRKMQKNKLHKTQTLTLTALILLSLTIIVAPSFTQKAQAASDSVSDNSFSIFEISDTQFLSGYFPTLFDNLTSWIVNNSAAYNLKMVVHTGDLVNNGSSPFEWSNANASMSTLLNAGIPYCWDAGNNDQMPINNPNGTALASNYLAFNATNMRSKSYWVDDICDAKNTAVKFTSNGFTFLIINTEYLANNTVIEWMKNLLNINNSSNVIIGTHSYLNDTAGYGLTDLNETAWVSNFKTLLGNYSNIFLTMSGHDVNGYGANMTRVSNREEVFFNRQNLNNYAGAAAVRIYSFNLTSMQVNASTYAVDTQTWLTDAYNQFSFNVTLNSNPTPTPTSTPIITPTPTLAPTLTPASMPTPTSTLTQTSTPAPSQSPSLTPTVASTEAPLITTSPEPSTSVPEFTPVALIAASAIISITVLLYKKNCQLNPPKTSFPN